MGRMGKSLYFIKILGLILVILIISGLLSGCKPWTVVKINKEENNKKKNEIQIYFEDTSFDAEKYVNSIWEKQVIPYVEQKAVDLKGLLEQMQKISIDEVGKKFGVRRGDESNPWNFLVKGEGKIIKVDTSSPNGIIEVDILPYDGKSNIVIQIGPVINGTSIRDVLEFISFDKFVNQIQLADIADAFNNKVYQDILSKIDFNKAVGKKVSFIGAFTYEEGEKITITPIEFKMQ